MSDDLMRALADEADRLLEDATYSAKGHFESAREWGRWNLWLGVPSVILATLAGVSGFNDIPTLAGGTAVFGGACAAVLTFLRPSERASAHQTAGTLYNSLKSRVRFFREVDLVASRDPNQLREQLHQLAADRNSLNESSPEILRPAFKRARAGIATGEASYRVDRSPPTGR